MTQMAIITGDTPHVLLAQMDADLAASPLPPFEDECIVVQSLGMERWVRQQLAMRRGCAASLAMPFPAAFCRRLAAGLQAGGIDARFEEQALVWRIFALLQQDDLLRDPVCEPLRAFVDNGSESKRYGLARRIATCFDEYRLYRPDVLLEWEAGRSDCTQNAHEPWQAALWRTLLAGEQPPHFARWFMGTVHRLEQRAERPAGLPERVSVFGVSTLPPLFIRLLKAVARFVPVRFYVLLPDADSWREGAVRHPLFETFGSSSRELLTLLEAPDATGQAPVRRHVADSTAVPSDGVLQQLQRALRRAEPAPVVVRDHDRSLTVHATHSPLREMEVLRDQLLDAFAADPTLRPHDVLVMTPDVELYAPFAESIFGDTRGDRAAIPYRVADRTLARETMPARATVHLLQLVTARLTTTDVLELLSYAVVRRAAGISAAQLAQVTHWVEEAAIRWGRDGEMRMRDHGTPSFEENSWRWGLDRLLSGYAAGRVDTLVDGVLPVGGDLLGDTDLLGTFAVWIDALFARLEALREPRPLGAWTQVLQDAVRWLVVAEGADEHASMDRLLRDLERLGDLTRERGQSFHPDQPVTFDVVRDWVTSALGSDDHPGGFLTGGLTLCAMKPMRAIPHRVIAMLGLDDRAYPRRHRRAAFDLLSSDPRRGDRDARADDRQLVLDTLMSAGDRLILSYVGRSQQNNAEIAPSVVIAELLDRLDLLASTLPAATTHEASTRLRVEHPLQPFSAAYFVMQPGDAPRLFSFDREMADSVRAAAERHAAPPFLAAAPPVPVLTRNWRALSAPRDEITIDDLVEAWTNPARLYCRRVLQLSLPSAEEALDEVEPMAINALLRSKVQQRMLDRTLRGAANDAEARALAVASGDLPVAALGLRWYDALQEELEPLVTLAAEAQFVDPLPVNIEGADWRLRGHLDLQTTDSQWCIRAARLKAKDKARAWILHVVRCAAAAPVATRLVSTDKQLVLAPIDDAHDILDILVQGYRAALAFPLPYFLEAGCAYSEKIAKGEPGLEAAQRAFLSDGLFGSPGDGRDPYVALLWRGRSPIPEHEEAFVGVCDAFWTRLHEVLS